MKKISLLAILLVSLFNVAYAADEVAPEALENGSFCLFSTVPEPQYKYKALQKVKFGKGAYGNVKGVLPRFVAEAKAGGADAVINYTGSQRFGFWPWRIVRPVLRGDAIKWDGTPADCKKMGGLSMQEIIAADKGPDDSRTQEQVDAREAEPAK